MTAVKVTDDTSTEEIEAEVRRCMTRLTTARGWDTQRTRAGELALIDDLLDEYLARGVGAA